MKYFFKSIIAICALLLLANNRCFASDGESGFGIICSDISSDGIGTAYSKHTFFLDNGSESASNLEWSFKLKKANGDFAVISTGSGNRFTIDEIVDYEGYLVDLNGNLKGTIECSYSVDGNIQDAKPFELSLELKPIIFSIEKQIQYNSDYSYNAILDINYAGAHYVIVEVEEEYDSAVRSYRVYEPYNAHLQTGKITALYDSWITVEVSNQYGTASETFYFPPNYSFYDSIEDEFVLDDIKYDNMTHMLEINVGASVELFDITGRVLFSGTGEQTVSLAHLQGKCAIIRYVFNNGVYNKKLML